VADAKISALTAVTTPAGTDEFAVNEAGTSKKITLSQIDAYTSPIANGSVTDQTGFATDTYVTRSGLVVVGSRLQAGAWMRWVFNVEKTAAGVATAAVTLRMGTAGTTADAAICTFNFASAGTAATDKGRLEVIANFNSVGSGTSAVVEGNLFLIKQNSNTGFVSAGSVLMAPITVTSSGFNSTTVTNIGLSLNAGTSASWTVRTVQAEIQNLAA